MSDWIDFAMVTVRLQEIEERVKRNMKKYEKQIEDFEKATERSDKGENIELV
ncbi:hypothetical protein [Bacillus sp. FJAT-42315]|uniref:hypothetical protein n=1 Tax=Bacillus sp. FJAT-42315 TaxID=2014077 RepID=UPI0012FE985E|nr:hypothetical protein [Bacillus sp. FJAT-42315]